MSLKSYLCSQRCHTHTTTYTIHTRTRQGRSSFVQFRVAIFIYFLCPCTKKSLFSKERLSNLQKNISSRFSRSRNFLTNFISSIQKSLFVALFRNWEFLKKTSTTHTHTHKTQHYFVLRLTPHPLARMPSIYMNFKEIQPPIHPSPGLPFFPLSLSPSLFLLFALFWWQLYICIWNLVPKLKSVGLRMRARRRDNLQKYSCFQFSKWITHLSEASIPCVHLL